MFRRQIFATLLASLVLGVGVRAQPVTPHLGYVFPAGGRQGSEVKVAVGGQYLNNATNAYLSGSGARAAFIDYTRPLTPKEDQ